MAGSATQGIKIVLHTALLGAPPTSPER